MSRRRKSKGSRNRKRKAPWLLLTTGGAVAAMAVWASIATTSLADADIVVYKTPTCSCCGNWVAHLRDAGLEVSVVNVSNTQPIPSRLGVPRQLGSCHTAVVGDYWVEGHVPADLIQ